MELVFFYFGIFLAAIAQILLKKSTKIDNDLNLKILVIGGYILLFIVTVINLWVFKTVPAKMMIVSPVSIFLVVTFLSRLLFGENISKRKKIGCILIIVGIGIFSTR